MIRVLMRSMRSWFIIRDIHVCPFRRRRRVFPKISACLYIVFICLWIDPEVFVKTTDGLAINLEEAENC